MGWPPSPAHILNQKSNPLGIPYDSVRSENALERFPTGRNRQGSHKKEALRKLEEAA